MAHEFRPGQIAPETGIYRIAHHAQHVAQEREVTIIKGRRFPTCRHCPQVSFELTHAAKNIDEIPHLEHVDPMAITTKRYP